MSTFEGKVAEFPDIRIDYFRPSNSASKPALAFFLSHVHSDHLVGLESCKSPFIYCSPATRDILLRLEKYPHRMNFAKGILETRKQTYRHLKNLLKAIPLETPTVIELSPGKEIRVTLFNANHCVGAVMFLIEGGGSAVLYTGDIRSEPWWVNALTRQPVLLPYVCSFGLEPMQKLDSIYLDTTFVATGQDDLYAQFPSKAEGLRELLQKVAKYPQGTLFYLDAWTFGYEDVWQALSSLLGSRVHVDDYRYGLHCALANGVDPKAAEAAMLVGFYCGNHFQQGCLSARSDECRIHSCEKGTGCEIWGKDFVRITPIVSRHNGVEIAELGAGGGQGDLNQQHELEVSDAELVGQLMALCASKLHGQTQLLSSVLQMLTSVINDRVQSIKLEDFNLTNEYGSATGEDHLHDLEDLPLEKLVPTLAKIVMKQKQKKVQSSGSGSRRPSMDAAKRGDGLPKCITFPYSRHSSYNELCQLIEAFKPKNIHPCTVDEVGWTPSSSMSFLFGHIYSARPSFRHDQVMLKKKSVMSKPADHNSRQASSQSSSSHYATPKAYASVPQTDSAQKAMINAPKLPSKHNRSDDHHAQTTDISSTKRNKHERQPQDDYGRSVNVDHYSPPHDRKRRKSSTGAISDQIDDGSGTDWPALTPTDAVPVNWLDNRWRKRIAETMPPEWQFEDDGSSKKENQRRRSSNYGRLSPPPIPKKYGEDTNDGQDHFDNLVQRRKDYEERTSSKVRNYSSPKSPRSSSPAQSRLAFRQEVYDAVLGKNGASWSDIGLVSVSGHQIREEEL